MPFMRRLMEHTSEGTADPICIQKLKEVFPNLDDFVFRLALEFTSNSIKVMYNEFTVVDIDMALNMIGECPFTVKQVAYLVYKEQKDKEELKKSTETVKNLEEEMKKLKEKFMCSVCYDKEIDMALEPW